MGTTEPLHYVQLLPIFSGDDKLSIVTFFQNLDQIQRKSKWKPHILLAISLPHLNSGAAIYWQENPALFNEMDYEKIKQVMTKRSKPQHHLAIQMTKFSCCHRIPRRLCTPMPAILKEKPTIFLGFPLWPQTRQL